MRHTDEQIKTDIVNRLHWDAKIDATDVLIEVNEGVVTLAGTVTKILCPTDFSEASLDGLKNANKLADHFSAEIILLNVVSPLPSIPGSNSPTGFHIPAVLEDVEASAKDEIKVLQNKYISSNIKSKGIVVIGDPPAEIVKRAADDNVDVIVMSTHGQPGWKRLVCGSVTEKVVRTAECPVLTIR